MPGGSNIRAGRAFVELEVYDKLTAGLKKAALKLQAFGASVRAIGQKLVMASAVAAAPLALSATVFAGFEQQMARVQALTGATGAQFQQLADEAKRLGETTVYSARQAAEAMGNFALAGYNTAKILKSIGPTLMLAAAGQLDIAQASDITVKIMAGMGLEAEQLGYAVDVLTKAMTTANTDLVQLGDAMKFVGPIAKSAGIRFEEVTAAVQLLSNAGIQGEMAGTSLRGAILALASPSAQAATVLQQLGVTVKDTQGDMLPLAAIIEQLSNVMANMGSAEKLDVLGRIFPARTAAGVAELLSQGAGKLREYTAALEDAGGTAARIADVQLNTLQGDATLLKSALEGLGIAVGEALVATLRTAVQSIIQVVGALAAWVRQHQATLVLITQVIAAVAALGGALVAFGVIVQATGMIVGAFSVTLLALQGVFLGLGAAITVLGTLIKTAFGLATVLKLVTMYTYGLSAAQAIGVTIANALTIATNALSAALAAMGAVMNAIPVILVLTAILAAAVAAYKAISMVIGAHNQLAAQQANTAKEQAAYALLSTGRQELAAAQTIEGRIQALKKLQRAYADLARLVQESGVENADVVSQRWAEKAAEAAQELALLQMEQKQQGMPGPEAAPAVTDRADLDERIHQLRLDQIQDEHDRELALLIDRYNREWAAASQFGDDRKKIEEAFALERAALEQKHALAAKELELRRAGELRDARIALIDDANAREIALIHSRYDLEVQLAKLRGDAAAAQHAELMRQLELQAQAARRAAAIADQNQARRETIAELELQLSTSGDELKRALLELERARAVRDAGESGADPSLVNREFDLKRQLLEQQLAAAGERMSVVGTFNAVAASGLGGGNSMERTARATEETARYTKRIAEKAGALQFA